MYSLGVVGPKKSTFDIESGVFGRAGTEAAFLERLFEKPVCGVPRNAALRLEKEVADRGARPVDLAPGCANGELSTCGPGGPSLGP